MPGWLDARRTVRRSPLTIALFAVVVLALGGGATAFAMMDKTVRLDVDGQRLSVRTFAGNVAGVLRKAHLVVGPHDTVAPDLSAPVRDGSQIVVRHGKGGKDRIVMLPRAVRPELDQQLAWRRQLHERS